MGTPIEAIEIDNLTKLPNEVLHNIMKGVDPKDLANLSLCCHSLRHFISDNKPLYKDMYLQILDEPPKRPNSEEFDWAGEVHQLERLRGLFRPGKPIEEKKEHLGFVAKMITSYMKTASPEHSLNVALLTDLFADRSNREAFLCQSTIFSRARKNLEEARPLPFESRQLSAKLHTLYGVPIECPCRSRFDSSYPYACSVVYDLRNYTDNNLWGPFMDDGLATVDWERMEAVMVILGYNLRMFTENTHGIFKPLWAQPWVGASPNSYSPITVGDIFAARSTYFSRFLRSLTRLEKPAPPQDADDPYNVSGTWMRVVCFLDFSELFAYNFNSASPDPATPRQPIETTEAIRLIIMEIATTRITDPDPEEGDHEDWPVVHFKGTSRSMHSSWDPNANSSIRGTVRMTREGEVRWTTVSVYGGEERWKSEGIQVGGLRSSRGVLGHWFDKDLDPHGPAGPTAFWKVSNEIDDSTSDSEPPGHPDDDDEEDDEDYDGDGDGDEMVETLEGTIISVSEL